MENITYQTNEQLWRIENTAASAGYKKTNDCYWGQIFRNSETGHEFGTSREENSTNDPAADLAAMLNPAEELDTEKTVTITITERDAKRLYLAGKEYSLENFRRIHQILLENGYPESHDSDWYIQIEVFQRPRIIPHWYDCHTKYRAKVAVRSLLNKTDVYSVTVFNPITGPISFYGRFNDRAEHEWSYYFD